MSRYFCACSYCGKPLAAPLVQANGELFCSSGCHEAHELEIRRMEREQSNRRDQALQRQADSFGALRTGIIAAGLFLMIALQGCASGSWGCDSASDHYGPDERAHAAAGRLALR